MVLFLLFLSLKFISIKFLFTCKLYDLKSKYMSIGQQGTQRVDEGERSSFTTFRVENYALGNIYVLFITSGTHDNRIKE